MTTKRAGQLSPLSISSYAAITIQRAENVIVEGNIIDLGQSRPIEFQKCGKVKVFNNRTPGGGLIPGFNRDSQQSQGNFASFSDVEDATLISL